MADQNDLLERLIDEATQQQRQNLSESKRLAEEALALSEALANPTGQVLALRLLAAVDLQQGRMDEGATTLERALTIARHVGEAAPLSACLHTKGWLHHARGELLEAVLLYREAIALRMSPGEEIGRANTYNLLGITFRELGDFEQALRSYAQARELHRRQNNPSGEGNCLNNLGTLEGDRKCYPEALRYYQEALECGRACGDLLQETVSLYNIAHQYVLMGQPHRAVAFARLSRSCARRLNSPGQIAMGRLLDGMVSCARRLFPRAERSLLAALAQSQELKDTHTELRILNELGNLYLNWQKPLEAQRYLESCLGLGEAMQANLQLATCHEYLVEAMEQQQNYERALFHHREFYRLERQRFDGVADKQRLALRMSLDIERTEREAVAHQQRNAELEELTRRDSMTGLYNHRAFHELLGESLKAGDPLALLLLDVDHFKPYNDAFGHPAGDEVLQKLAQILQESIRKSDIAARYGGEEFAIILKGDPAQFAYDSALRLGKIVRETVFPHRKITLSIGVALATPGGTSAHLVAAADAALYRAKKSGRDCWAKAA